MTNRLVIRLRCKHCDKAFTPNHKHHTKFCSKKCKSKYWKKKTYVYKKKLPIEGKICKSCNKKFSGRNNKLFCSESCKNSEFMKRKRKRWVKRGRQSGTIVYREIIHSFFDSKCFKCKTKKDLHIHHKVLVSLGGSNHYTNIMILCKPCHMKLHREL